MIKKCVSKKDRAKRPIPSENYRSKTQIAARLVKTFKKTFPDLKIQAVVADALYGSHSFYDDMDTEVPQLISHLKKDQCLTLQGKKYSVSSFLTRFTSQ